MPFGFAAVACSRNMDIPGCKEMIARYEALDQLLWPIIAVVIVLILLAPLVIDRVQKYRSRRQ